MAILPMKKIHLVGLNRNRTEILEFLQRQGVVELSTPLFDENNGVFSQHDCGTVVTEILEKNDFVQRSLGIFAAHDTEKPSMFAMFEGKENVSVSAYEAFKDREADVYEIARKICQLDTRASDLEAERIRWENLSQELVPWQTLTVPLNYTGTRHTAVFIGSVPGNWTYHDLVTALAKADPTLEALHVEVVHASQEQTSIMVWGLKEEELDLKNALDLLDFRYPQFQSGEIPSNIIQDLLQKEEDAKVELEQISEEIASFATQREDIEFLGDYYHLQAEMHKASCLLGESRHAFLLEGFIPERESKRLEERVTTKFASLVQFTDPTEEEIPVLLKNNWFSEPTESVVTSFSFPGSGEIDPTSVMSIFYYVMFGLMFSDAGYGLILSVACAFVLLKFKNIEPSMNRTLRMFFWCGVSTICWGIVFSSYFGNVVEAVSGTFFGNAWNIPPLWFDPLEKTMLLLILCLGIGVVHLVTGDLLGFYTGVKNKDYGAAIFDSGMSILFLVSILTIFLGSEMFHNMAGFSLTLAPIVVTICKVLALVACIVVVFFGGRESKNWGKRIAKGLFALYNMVAGWLSDILSYSRLLALGLATGIIGTVVNTIGALGGKSISGVIIFILVFVLGHALNFGINILGAYVHSNRLEYVEFFGKFYEGGGKKFAPFEADTKYYNIREELENG